MAEYSVRGAFGRFMRMLSLDKKDISLLYLYALVSGLIALSLPLGIQALIGLVMGGRVSASWFLLVALVVLGIAVGGIVKIIQISVTETLQRRVFVRSAFEFAHRFPHIKPSVAQQFHLPELANRFFDTITIQKSLPKILIDFTSAAYQLLLGLIVLSFYHSSFILFSFLLLGVLILILRFTGLKGFKTNMKESSYKYEVAYWLEELARTTNTFKLAGNSPIALKETDHHVGNYLKARASHFRVLMVQYGALVAFKSIVTGGLIVLGSMLVMNNDINIGQFVAAEIIIILIMDSVEKLILGMETVYDVLTATEKIGQIADLPLETNKGMLSSELCKGNMGLKVDLNQLSFKFKDTQKQTLKNITLSIPAGQKVCITGYPGSGKTTLLRIISGIEDDFTGTLAFNDVPSNNINLNTLRERIGDFSGKEDIFRGSIMQNITLGHAWCTMEEVKEAVEAVGLKKYILNLEHGYETMLLPGARNIPRSITSKILMARCIVAKPNLLSIVESFRFLDDREYDYLIQYLTSKDKTWTLFIISFDPYLASKCDRVVILKDGVIVEDGTFEQIEKSVHFAQVFKNKLQPDQGL